MRREVHLVRDHGARGDGVNDDTTAFVAALAAARPGDLVRVDAGHYRLTRSLTLPSGIALEGDMSLPTLDFGPLDSYGIVASDVAEVTVRTLTIVGAARWRVVLERTEGAMVVGCVIGRSALRPDRPAGGLLVTAARDTTVLGNRFAGNGRSGRPAHADIQVNGLGQGVTSNLKLIENTCASRDVEFNICAFDVQHVLLKGNRVGGARTGPGDNGGYGVVIYGTVGAEGATRDVDVTDNEISGTEGSGIYVVRANGGRVLRNRVRDTTTRQRDHTLPTGAVVLNDATGFDVLSNEVARTGGAGVAVSASAPRAIDARVDGNVVVDAGRAAVLLRGPVSGVRITNNTLTGAAPGLATYSHDRTSAIVVEGNAVVGAGRSVGIALDDVTGAVVRNNRLRRVVEPAIVLGVRGVPQVTANLIVDADGVTRDAPVRITQR